MSQERGTSWAQRRSREEEQCSPADWTRSSALVEELLETETSVISDRNMAILKEQRQTGSMIDPALMSDVRHNKDIRSTISSGRSPPTNSEIFMEAKRMLKREEKAKKIITIQNKIVDNEVDRFQNHITSLRKMNQKLERLAFPAPNLARRKTSKGHLFHVPSLVPSDGASKIHSLQNNHLDHDILSKTSGNVTVIKQDDHCRQPSDLRKKSSLAISGQKMEEHDILQHNPALVYQSSSESQNTVFERIHQKYIESERNRVLKEGAAFIRHSSPVNDGGGLVTQLTATNAPKFLPVAKDHVHLAEWVEDASCSSNFKEPDIQKTEVCMEEWTLPSNGCEIKQAPKRLTDVEKSELSTKTLPHAATALKKAELNKLESMSKMYAKWMSKVCVTPGTKYEHLGPCKSKVEQDKAIGHNSISREEKIMQVLHAIQKQKDNKTNVSIDMQADKSRFSKSVNDIREEKIEPETKFRRAISGSYEHRIKAHKDLISHQKAKLEDQQKQIEELKLSQLRMENEKSQMQVKKTLNEVMDSCNQKVKAQAKSLKSSLSLADLSPGNDFVLRMEQRAVEQKQRKLITQERRKQLEEERKRKMKEMEERRRQEEEELAKKRHDEAREMRRRERELRDETRREREKFIALERKADQFLKNKRLRYGLLGFKKLVNLRKEQENVAVEFYDRSLLRSALRVWRREVHLRLEAKMDCADNFFASNLLHRCFNAFRMAVHERMRRMQVAMDMHDLHLQERYFHLWLKFTHEQQEMEAEKMAKADLYFSKVLLRRHLHLWKKYPEVAQLEREKERRKMMWRNKVQQLLPDFRPVLASD
ncbi:uncharacterized protein F23F12.8 [Thrips palmi]|uniref:Uncharacterized protein F23F12.8 n=1 Tax=Thrips palmi TaxID=161013 RepID=A0A6P8Z4P1_THRPL|nr:uncharacterized protein F23F12.8 [Thrips palmi]XP_034244746.1 uncharacterized protein F23F12.8 [Thrips palmi]XP_034244754.1 uncharacterized protein F23F12.8 [Thrips palmi]